MRAAEVAFVGALVHRFPTLDSLLQEHLDDLDGLLPHVFLGDVTRWVVRQADVAADSAELGAVLEFFETVFSRGRDDEQELIAASFLENLPRPGEPGSKVRDQLGPELAQQLKRIG